jgi:hypothetical protein
MAILNRGCGDACSGKKGTAVAVSAAPLAAMNARLVITESFAVILVSL